MAKLMKPSVLIYGTLVVGLLVTVIVWWTAGRTFDGVGRRVDTIPGMKSGNIYTVLESHGFRKEQGEVADKTAYKNGRQLVEIFETRDGVCFVRVTVRPMFSTNETSFGPEDTALYGLVAMTSYDGAKTSQNKSWASANFHKSAKRDDGVTIFETKATDNIRFLTVRPSHTSINL